MIIASFFIGHRRLHIFTFILLKNTTSMFRFQLTFCDYVLANVTCLLYFSIIHFNLPPSRFLVISWCFSWVEYPFSFYNFSVAIQTYIILRQILRSNAHKNPTWVEEKRYFLRERLFLQAGALWPFFVNKRAPKPSP